MATEVRIVGGYYVTGHVARDGRFVDVRPATGGTPLQTLRPHPEGGLQESWRTNLATAKGVQLLQRSRVVTPGLSQCDGNGVITHSEWMDVELGQNVLLPLAFTFTEERQRADRDAERQRSLERERQKAALQAKIRGLTKEELDQAAVNILRANAHNRQWRRDVRRYFTLHRGYGCKGHHHDLVAKIIALAAGLESELFRPTNSLDYYADIANLARDAIRRHIGTH